MREVLNFEDNNILFSLYVKEGKVVYQKQVNENISYELEDNEINLINFVFSSLMPSNNIKDLGIIKYNNKEINHLYDLSNKFHIFFEGDEEITKECLNLNYLFNNQEEYVFFANYNYDRNFSNKFVSRKIIIGKKVLSVLISSAFLLTSTMFFIKGGQKVYNFVENYRYNQKVEEYSNREIQMNEIVGAINENPYLTEVEKEFFLSCPSFFEDNIEYFDYYTVLDYLKKLRIEYVPESNLDPNIRGQFRTVGPDRGIITIYNATCFEDAPKYVLSHEFLHVFTKYSGDYNYIYEGINVVMNNEYYGVLSNNTIYDNGYKGLMSEIYILCELIDPENLKKYHAENDISCLIDPLMQIIPDYDIAFNLLVNIDFISKAELGNTDGSLDEEIRIKKEEINKTLRLYFETKYQIQVTSDNYALFLFNPLNASTKIASELGLDRDCILQADELTIIKQYKKVFNKTGNDNLVLSICDELKEVPKYYTLEEVLNGDTGFLYRTKEEIDLEEVEDGIYRGVGYKPVNYIDYEVIPSYEKNNSISK